MKKTLLLFVILLVGCASSQKTIHHSRALTFGAVLSYVNHEPLATLTDGPISDDLRQAQQKSLSEWWEINSRSQFLDTLKWIQESGHRKILWEIRERLKSVPIEKLPEQIFKDTTDRDDFNRKFVAVISLRAPKRPVVDITAWDYGRYINLCRWGYLCGYISEQEAWDFIMPVARFLKASYSSWDEYAEDYLRGREFWSLTHTINNGNAHRTAAKALTEMDVPWRKTSWALPLGDGPVAQDHFLLSIVK